jgi:hypothetical protein
MDMTSNKTQKIISFILDVPETKAIEVSIIFWVKNMLSGIKEEARADVVSFKTAGFGA